MRFLLDDINFKKRDRRAAILAAHPNIEVRIFNPHRFGSMRLLEVVPNFSRLNKRMHNKIMVADNACGILGGRNIADEYFGMNESYNNRDLDMMAVGPVVTEISATFDEFWNSIGAVPIEVLVNKEFDGDDYRSEIAFLRNEAGPKPHAYSRDLATGALRARIRRIESQLVWARGEVLHDTVDSMKRNGAGATLERALVSRIAGSKRELLIESAYFVMREPGIDFIRSLTSRGVRVRVLTNSLASNDVLVAQAGYSKRRGKLIDAGVDHFELRPDAVAVLRQVTPEARGGFTTLHTKALVIDGEKAFVGSYNLDPRSAEINSEIGLMVHSPVFARQVKAFLDEGVRSGNAYSVVRDGRGRVQWRTNVGGEPRTWSRDPETNGFRRFLSGTFAILPIENQL